MNIIINFVRQRWLIIIASVSFLALLIMVNFAAIQNYLLPLIEQKFANGLFRVESSRQENIVILTIDDGISNRTMEMLELLDKYNAKATFFIHKKNTQEVNNYREIITKIIQEGHELGNHTTQDIPSRSLSEEEFKQEFKEADTFLRDFDFQPRFFRAAGGFYKTSIMKPLLKENNYEPKFIMGSFLPWDTFFPLPNIYANQLIDNIFSGAIVVFHDGTQKGEGRLERTFTALKIFLKGMEEKEYRVISLGQALEVGN